MSGPNTSLNTMSGGDTVRDIDVTGTGVKAQVMLHGDPALLVTLRTNITTANSPATLVSNSAGTRLAVTQAYAKVDSGATVNVTFIIGFANPTTTGVILSDPGLAPGATPASRGDGGGIIAVGADGQAITITNTVPTGGSMDVILTYMPLPTAGI